MFPTGTPGIALLMLRVSVAGTLFWAGLAPYAVWPPWLTASAIILAAGLCIGFLTPYCACLCCVIELCWAFLPGSADEFLRLLSALNAVVLAMIGPGAYSVDSRLFGRRLLTLPPRKARGPY